MAEFEQVKTDNAQKCRNVTLATRFKDSCVLLPGEDFAFIKEKRQNGTLVCDVIRKQLTNSFLISHCIQKCSILFGSLDRAVDKIAEGNL